MEECHPNVVQTSTSLSWVVHIYLKGRLCSIKKRINITFSSMGLNILSDAHRIKTNISLVSIGKMKRLVSASKYFILMIVKQKEEDIKNVLASCDPNHKQELINIISNYDELFQEPIGLPPKIEVEHEIYLQNAPLLNIRMYSSVIENAEIKKQF
jgi:hypothetical protein